MHPGDSPLWSERVLLYLCFPVVPLGPYSKHVREPGLTYANWGHLVFRPSGCIAAPGLWSYQRSPRSRVLHERTALCAPRRTAVSLSWDGGLYSDQRPLPFVAPSLCDRLWVSPTAVTLSRLEGHLLVSVSLTFRGRRLSDSS